MIKKIFFTLLFLGFLFCSAQETVIQAGIKYNEATARIQAFKDIERKIDKKLYREYLKDPNRKENLEAISNNIYNIEYERILCPFYFKKTLISYAVTYHDEPLKIYYYNVLGNLVKFEICEGGFYPRRTFAYSRYGNLLSVNFDIDGTEQFMYEQNGKLIAHWVGDNYTGKHSKILNITRGKNPNEKDD